MFLLVLHHFSKKLAGGEGLVYNRPVIKSHKALVLGVLVFLICSLLALWNPLHTVQWKLSDLMFRGGAVSNDITIIAIDDKSLSPEADLGRFKDWPRSYYAQLLLALNKAKPAVVAFDLDFREHSNGVSALRLEQMFKMAEEHAAANPNNGINWYDLLKKFDGDAHPDDTDFQKAMNESGAVVLTSTLVTTVDNKKKAIDPIFSGKNITMGYKNATLDKDGVLRRFTPRDASSETVGFPLAIAQAFKKDTTVPAGSESVGIRYVAKPHTYHAISFFDVLTGNFDPSLIANKIILVGGTAPILQDLRVTPTSPSPMPGVEINATMVQQILDGKFMAEQGNVSLVFELLLLAVGGMTLFVRMPLKYVGWLFGAVFVAIPAGAFALYQMNAVANVVYPVVTWILTVIGALWYRNETEFKEKRAIRNAFAHYVSPVVVDELAKNPQTLKLGGRRENITVLFSDIVGFTTLAEKLTPEDTVALLNDYLTVMTEVIFGFHGTLDKYQGDAIMALFGAPLADPSHGINACASALGMRKALVALHERWNGIQSLPFKDELIRLDFRVGIATGPAIIGNVGSEKRFDYTAIGDIVNLGSRLESVNKRYGTHIIVDKETFATITSNNNAFVFRKLDTIRVKGKEIATEIFEVVGLAESVTNDMRAMLDDFENGRILYTQRNFIDAKQYFEAVLTKLPEDGPSQIYLNRCNFYLRKPPRRDWDAIVDLEEK